MSAAKDQVGESLCAVTRQSIDGMDRRGLRPREDEMSDLAKTHGAFS